MLQAPQYAVTTPSLRGAAFSRQKLAMWWVLAIQEAGSAGRQVGGKAWWQGMVASACRVALAPVI
jgi:hypothetical protein